MHTRGLIFWLILSFYRSAAEDAATEKLKSRDNFKSTYSANDLLLSDSSINTCSIDDFACLTMAANDRLGLEAIKTLHQKLDDDANGNVDLSESDDFLREELQYDSGYERRQKAFHRNDDMHISVKELWEAWLKSEVHNWTVEQTTDWLVSSVDLPQYVPSFISHKVTGANLPRLAANNVNYLNHLGIKDPIHKQKIVLKAMDVVLFGPPKDGQPHWKDLTLIVLLIGGGIGVWYAFQQNKKFKNHLNRMNRDMDSLQNAEKALENLQKELEEAKQAQEDVITEKQNLEKKLQDSKTDLDSLPYSDLEVNQLKAEIEMLRTELQIAEGELKDRCWSPPPGLQQWLQLTHEIENKAYMKKKASAEKQLQQAREACEKLRKKRSSLVGAFVSTHGKSIDEVDRSIVEARTALNEVTQELQERVHRWKQIEMLCGFSIINNNGLQFLENTLYRNTNGRALPVRGRISSQDDLDDDTASLYGHQGHSEGTALHSWKEGDSSGSETSRQEEDSHSESKPTPGVHFMVGGEISTWPEDSSSYTKISKLSSNPRSISNNNIPLTNKSSQMTRSFSQDTNVGTLDSVKPKSSLSDTSLDAPLKPKPLRQTTIKEQPSASIEEDICSTDSSLMDEDIKKKKKKLFAFTKKSKGKND
ncbi:stromal interaction molecule homolog isoform X2 [Tribolium castaneum]|uniref:Stromal interaction molecule homolog-like Protein n=1 Tax=Tribolium castaneum TaxID=7070 RepID=D1ZZW7_TRICA|nr:PREDICTED: stromal interaction molecule homolog isoform X2 [Tribolium castaneum]EFA02431.1 Stromal interaction molecule homolog-like Protein [Tribolium castaneum]|eukprot:XP_975159.2 PREDICTED: stromal interaction molecule homolog isoform X2 [Tribolium castaneum]